MSGRKLMDIWIEKYGEEEAKIKHKEMVHKMSKNSGTRGKKYIDMLADLHGEEEAKIIYDKMVEKCRKASSGKNNPMYGKRLCGSKNGFYGKKHTKEAREKMSKANIGRTITEKHRKKLRELMSGKNNQMYGIRGEQAPSSKLTLEIVKEIRKRYKEEKISMAKLGKQYGVSPSCVYSILHNKTWRVD